MWEFSLLGIFLLRSRPQVFEKTAECTLYWLRAKGHNLWGFNLFSACRDFFDCLSSAKGLNQ